MRPRESSEAPTTLALDSNADLVARAQRGEEAAFASLFGAQKGRVYRLCLRMTHSPADAEDLTQDMFLQVFRKIATFRGESTFSTWLHRLVVNGVLMHLRKRRLETVSLDGVDAREEGPVKWELGHDDPDLTGTVDRLILDRVVAALPFGYRSAFLLHDVEGYQHSEIARIMNWSVGNSKSQLHKARRRLRGLLRFPGVNATREMTRVESRKHAKNGFPPRNRATARGMNRLEPILTP